MGTMWSDFDIVIMYARGMIVSPNTKKKCLENEFKNQELTKKVAFSLKIYWGNACGFK
jgi:hypothetical protein